MALVFAFALGVGAQTKPSSSLQPPASGQKGSKPSPAASTRATPAAKRPARATTRRRARPSPQVPIGQRTPTRDRYREIQQALAEAGCYEGAADGVWGDTSIQALKCFQERQGLEPTGKIDALSLIRLGLGPKYDSPQAAAPEEPGSSG